MLVTEAFLSVAFMSTVFGGLQNYLFNLRQRPRIPAEPLLKLSCACEARIICESAGVPETCNSQQGMPLHSSENDNNCFL
jgi:hypothetical protein